MADRPARGTVHLRRALVLGGCAALLASCARTAATTGHEGHLPPERVGHGLPAAPDPPPVREDPRQARIDPREEAFVDSVPALMTLPEKLGPINQYAGRWPGAFVVKVGTSSERVQGAEFELSMAHGQPVGVPERCKAA